MPVIEWSESLSVSVGEIDAQHRELVRLINELGDAMRLGKGREVLGSVLDGLITYSREHFATEERYFDLFGYADEAAHRKEHAEFLAKVSGFRESLLTERVGLSIRVMRFLGDWLVEHVQGSDRKYVPLFHEKGLS